MLPIKERTTPGEIPLPPEYKARMKKLLGPKFGEFCDTYEKEPVSSLRMNPLKKNLTPDKYEEILVGLSVSGRAEVPWAKGGFYYEPSPVEEDGCRPGRHPFHEMGLFYIQEASAMAPAALLGAKPGERVLDLCAAPGGKTTQIASGMDQQGLIVANEINPSRARILSRNVERMGIANALVVSEDSSVLAARFPGFFHRILVDAPCSGEGMFRKHPEARAEWSSENVKNCSRRQREILENAARMLLAGGQLVYSTCTFAPEEDERLIAGFLDDHPEFSLVRPSFCFAPGQPGWADGSTRLELTQRLWPHQLRGEGHFAAVLRREGRMPDAMPETGRQKRSPQIFGRDPARLKALEDFAGQVLREGERELLTRREGLCLFGDQLYRLPEVHIDLAGLNVLRPGLHLGSFKKDRFEPAHALALFLGKDQVLRAEEIGIPDMKKYQRGESLCTDEKKGWTLVCSGGFSAGWAKAGGGRLNNHYPKGLRR